MRQVRAALMVSDIRPIRDMGLWVAVGLSFTWVIAFTLFPALQRILRTPTRVERRAAAPWLLHLAAVLPRFSYRWRWPLVSGAVLLSAAGVVSIFGAGSYTALPAALWLVFRARPDDPAPRDLGSANPDESPGTPPSPRMR